MTVVSSLTLEQVPRFRGSMMPLNAMAMGLGAALGSSLGSLALEWRDYEGMGLILGGLCFIATLLYYFLAEDPTTETHGGG